MKKILYIFLFIFLLNSSDTVLAKSAPPPVSADSAVLMDAATGTILYSKNMNTPYPPASTTKLMTALLTIENTKMYDIATVSKKVPFVDGSKIGLFEEEQLPVKELLYGLLLMSGNDCAETLAEHVSGSISEFAKLMTKRAKELGCENTNFVNPSGLYEDNHRSSAKDLALIMREAMKHSEFKEITSTTIYKIPPTNKHPEGINLANENKIMYKNSRYYYEGAEGGKTGYTIQSRFSYVASASRNGQRLIAAFVHADNKSYYTDVKVLFDYGFDSFELVKLYSKGDLVSTFSTGAFTLPLKASEDYYYIKEKSSSDKPECNVLSSDFTNKYFKKGDNIAEASISINGNKLPNLKLLSGIDHEDKTVATLARSVIPDKINTKYSSYLIAATITAVIATTVIFKIKKRLSR